MRIEHVRAYRLLRVAIALARVFPPYVWLVVRGRWLSPGSQAAWDRAHARAANALRGLALSLAGAFTKAAQIGGARADVLPAAFIDRLSQFHDAVPPRDFETLRAIVERAIEAEVGEVFAKFDERAIAAASLAQVHRATLRDGSEVVVKIRYPEIPRIMPLDLGMLRRVATFIGWLRPPVDIRSLVMEVARFIELELDFGREVDSTERLGRILAGNPDVVVPRVVRELCSEDVIVLEYIEGIQVTRSQALQQAGHRASDIARRVGNLYGAMIFECGFFHGDPHPGNLLVLEDGRIGLLDFGLCKELPDGFARDTADMMVSALIGDSPRALSAAEKLGFDVSQLRGEHLRSLFLMTIGDSDGEDTLLSVLGESQIRRIPEDFALVVRTMVLLNGLSHRLAPGRRLVQAALLEHLARGAAAAAPPQATASA